MSLKIDPVRREQQRRQRGPNLGELRSGISKAAVLTLCVLAAACGVAEPTDTTAPAVGFNAEIAYLKELNEAAPAENPQVAAVLMMEYQNNGRQAEGSAFFKRLLQMHAGSMTPAQELVYLSALGILRAEAAQDVPLISRIGWVNETIEILERARDIGNNQVFFSRFAAAMVYARLPSIFGKGDQALTDFEWLVQNRDGAFQPGQMRLIYQTYAQVLRDAGREDEARELLAQANLELETPGLVTNFAVNAKSGATFRPPRFIEIIPDRAFLISGVEFTEHYFILSEDRQHLIAIDAGVTPQGTKAAYEILLKRVPDLPPLTTIFVTHAHWDHIGGHSYFRQLNPNAIFYGRDNYAEELAIMASGPDDQVDWFFGEIYDHVLIRDYKPDMPISAKQEVTIGGTRFLLIPAPGAETPDAMFIHMPDQGMLFVGDFIMPYSGAPFFEEGDVNALIEGIDLIEQLAPVRIWHGHEPLTVNWSTPARFSALRPHLIWMREAVRTRIRAGIPRAAIHRENLIPPTLFDDPESQVFFLAMREQMINRLFDQNVGYWGPEFTGLDHLSSEAYGKALTRYLGLENSQIDDAIDAMIAAGDFYLAERMVRWALAVRPEAERLKALQKEAALGLRDKYQMYNPFKFFLYSSLAEVPTRQLSSDDLPIDPN